MRSFRFLAVSILLFALTGVFSGPAQALEIYPLERVHRGLKAEGITVFSGEKPTAFGVTVLGVMPNFIGFGQDLILARLDGEEIEHTGVISGMSGSPVYVDGQLMGAVSYRLGSFSKEPIAGITPAALMLAAAKPAGSKSKKTSSLSLDGYDFNSLQPIDSPLVLAGVPDGLLGLYAESLRAQGFAPTRGAGGSKKSRGQAGPVFFPGGPMAGVLISGDLTMAAVGTVTMIDGDRIIGFGHPFLGRGTSRMPLATAEVLTTLPSLAGSFKISNVTGLVGTLYEDRSPAVVGRLGSLPKTLAIDMTIDGDDALLAKDQKRQASYQILLDPALTPLLSEISIATALGTRVGFNSGGSADVDLRIELGGRERMRWTDVLSVSEGGNIASAVASFTAAACAQLWGNPYRELDDIRIKLAVRLSSKERSTRLISAQVFPRTARPGQLLQIAVELADYRGKKILHRESLRVPDDARPGAVQLQLGGRGHLKALDKSSGRLNEPRSFDDFVENMNRRRESRRFYSALSRTSSGLRVDGQSLPDLPPSIHARLRLAGKGRSKAKLEREVLLEHSVSLDKVVLGGQSLKLTILPKESQP